MEFKRAQEYVGNYFKNNDGSYTISLKIKDPLEAQKLLEIKIVYPSRKSAIDATKKWKDVAPQTFEYIYDTLLSDDETKKENDENN